MTQEQILEKLTVDLQLRGLSHNTQGMYHGNAKSFMQYFDKPATELGEQEIRDYLYYLAFERKLSPSSVNNVNSSLRFLFEITLELNLNYKRIPRLKEPILLPNFMTTEEIKRFFDVIDNLKYKAILMTVYGSGLRLGEVCRLKINDVDSKAMRLHILQGKGKKDRYAVLSQAGLEAIREYWKEYKPKHPEGYLFLNRKKTACVAESSVQEAFTKYHKKAGIARRATVHTLRHSYATHLLEAGTSIFFIRQLLGHSKISTTLRYLHVAQTDVLKTPSPLDTLKEKVRQSPQAGDCQ